VKKPIIGSILLIAVVAAAIIFYTSHGFTPTPPRQDPRVIEESMQNVRAVRFDDNGQYHQTITMAQWLRYQGSTVTHMIRPTVSLQAKDSSQWHISANQGQGAHTALHQFSQIHLFDNVIIQRNPDDKNHWLQLSTGSLLFFPQKFEAFTQNPIHIRGPHLSLEAQGLHANLNEHSIEFLQKVTSVYAPS